MPRLGRLHPLHPGMAGGPLSPTTSEKAPLPELMSSAYLQKKLRSTASVDDESQTSGQRTPRKVGPRADAGLDEDKPDGEGGEDLKVGQINLVKDDELKEVLKANLKKVLDFEDIDENEQMEDEAKELVVHRPLLLSSRDDQGVIHQLERMRISDSLGVWKLVGSILAAILTPPAEGVDQKIVIDRSVDNLIDYVKKFPLCLSQDDSRGPVGELPIHLMALLGLMDDDKDFEGKPVPSWGFGNRTMWDVLDTYKRAAHKFGHDSQLKLAKLLVQVYERVDEQGRVSREQGIINEYTGENLLHILMVRENTEHSISKLISEVYKGDHNLCKKLLLMRVEGRFFDSYYGAVRYGQSPLHFAVSTGQINKIKLMIETAFSLFSERKEDKLIVNKILWQRDAEGNLPLHLAVKAKRKDAYDALVKLYTDPRWQGERFSSIEMDDDVKNKHMYTPLEYAAWLGHREMVKHIIETQQEVKWAYGPVQLTAFAIRDIDTYKSIMVEDSTDEAVESSSDDRSFFDMRCREDLEPNVLDIIVSNDRKELLTLVVVEGLLDVKWRQFGKSLFKVWFAIVSAVFLMFEVALYIRPAEPSRRWENPETGLDRTSIVLSVALFSLGILFLVNQLWFHLEWGFFRTPRHPKMFSTYRQSKKENFKSNTLDNTQYTSDMWQDDISPLPSPSFWGKITQLSEGVFQAGLIGVSGWVWSLSVIGAGVTRTAGGSEQAEDAFLSIASAAAWLYLLYFFRAFESTGSFVVMVQKMISADLPKWFSVTIVFILGFAQSMWILIRDDGEKMSVDSALLLFATSSIGEIDTDILFGSLVAFVMVVLFVMFVVLVPIVLFNLLIAMFSTTYEQVMEQSKLEWKMQKAKIILHTERVLYWLPSFLLFFLGYRAAKGSGPGNRRALFKIAFYPDTVQYQEIRSGIRLKAPESKNVIEADQHTRGFYQKEAPSNWAKIKVVWNDVVRGKDKLPRYEIEDDKYYLLLLSTKGELAKVYQARQDPGEEGDE